MPNIKMTREQVRQAALKAYDEKMCFSELENAEFMKQYKDMAELVWEFAIECRLMGREWFVKEYNL